MITLFLYFIGLSAIIVVAGTYLAKFGDVIADRTGMGGSLVGLILIAAATSLPELAVNCSAVQMDATDLALGAIVGSSLFNLLILGVMEYLHGSSHRIISPASRSHALSAIASMIMTALLAFFLLAGDVQVVGRFGLGPMVIAVAYLYCVRLIYLDQMESNARIQVTEEPSRSSLSGALWGFVAMTVVIYVAAAYLAPTANDIAVESGLGGTFVGTTFVAITTSLPELVTTLAAVRIGAFDMAVGNVFGSNAFNAAMLLPVDAFYRKGTVLGSVTQSHVHAMTASAVLVVTSVILVAMFHKPRRQKYASIMDPNATLVILISLLAIVAVYFVST